MASLIFGAGVLAYDAAHKKIQKRRATKARHDARFSELEKDNAARIARLRELCACGGNHAATDHPGGGGQPMGDLSVDTNSDEGVSRGGGERLVRRTTSMPAVGRTGGVVELDEDDPPPPAYEQLEAGAGDQEIPRRDAAKRRFFWRSRKMT